MLRTHTCGELRKKNRGKKVVLAGWAHNVRVFGKKAFIDLRDRYGITQIVLDEKFKDIYTGLSRDSVLVASGKVAVRKEQNSQIETGDIEVNVEHLALVSKAKPLPFEVFSPDIESTEETRLRHRYLDLRRPEMLRMLEFRFRAEMIVRNYLSMHNFIEIETPYLGKQTPEGARDFLVPSRPIPGSFWALQQSPQQYKQLLMVAGVDRYFQMARCFRDEDLRKDRQYEFTQIDMEMSFIDESDIMKITEGMVSVLYAQLLGIKLSKPFSQMTWEEAIEKYGSDKPDVRFGLKLQDYTEEFAGSGFRIFEKEIEKGSVVKGLVIPEILRKSDIEKFEDIVKKQGFPGLAWLKVADKLSGPVASAVSKEAAKKLSKEKGTLLFLAGPWLEASVAMGAVRLAAGEKLNLAKGMGILWVTDFPLFEWGKEAQCIQSAHHPFTMPKTGQESVLFGDLSRDEVLKVPARAYDLVINVVEIGGGSIRITDPVLQERIFEILGLTKKEARSKFGMLLKSFEYGAPPHGGIALGLERLLQVMLVKDSVRDVMAFPKSKSGRALMEGAPAEADPEQLKELKLK